MKTREGQVERLAYRYAEAAQAIGCCAEHIANLVKRGGIKKRRSGPLSSYSRGGIAKISRPEVPVNTVKMLEILMIT